MPISKDAIRSFEAQIERAREYARGGDVNAVKKALDDAYLLAIPAGASLPDAKRREILELCHKAKLVPQNTPKELEGLERHVGAGEFNDMFEKGIIQEGAKIVVADESSSGLYKRTYTVTAKGMLNDGGSMDDKPRKRLNDVTWYLKPVESVTGTSSKIIPKELLQELMRKDISEWRFIGVEVGLTRVRPLDPNVFRRSHGDCSYETTIASGSVTIGCDESGSELDYSLFVSNKDPVQYLSLAGRPNRRNPELKDLFTKVHDAYQEMLRRQSKS